MARQFESRTPVVNGTKTTTVRWDDPIAVGPATFVFEDNPENAALEGEVLAIFRHKLGSLTPEQAHLPVGMDMGECRRGLRAHYPDLPDDAEVGVVMFTVSARP